MRIHALVVLSNHWHALLTADTAEQLASFMAFVNGNIAREVGRLHRWRQRFWGRRYRSIVVADEAAALDRLRYILLNGCKEGLVDRPADWPGISSAAALTEGQKLRGTWYDRTAEGAARRRGERPAPKQFAKGYEVELTRLPGWEGLSTAEYEAECAKLVAEIEAETLAERKTSGRKCVGRARILAANPHGMPVASAHKPAPFVHASTLQAKLLFKQAYAAFFEAFRFAADQLRKGLPAEFPVGAFPPRLQFIGAQ